MKLTIFKALWLFLLLLPVSVPAKEQPQTFRGHFDFSWGGIPVGKIVLSYKEEGETYRIDSYARTTGLVRLFEKHKSTVYAEGRLRDAGYRPLHFRSEYRDEGENKRIDLAYDDSGAVIAEEILPPKRESRPDVPPGLKQDTFDILSALLAMRGQLRNALENNETSLTTPIFDGKRRFDLIATIVDTQASFYSGGVKQPAIALLLRRDPIAGFKDKELKKMAERDAPVTFYVHPDTLTPLGLEMEIYGAQLAARLEAVAQDKPAFAQK